MLAAGSLFAIGMALSKSYRTDSALRDYGYASVFAILGALAAWHAAEAFGAVSVIGSSRAWLLSAAAHTLLALGIVVYTLDMYFNFHAFRAMPGMEGRWRSAFAFMSFAGMVIAFWMSVLVFQAFDRDIYEPRGNFAYIWDEAALDAELHALVFCLDQTMKALLLDASEVYRFGLVAATNDPTDVWFSTLCLVYRTLISVFAVAVAIKVWRNRKA